MINYIKILNRQIEIHENCKIKIVDQTLNKYLNRILIDDLTTLKGRMDAVKNKYQFKKLIPLYINETLCLMPIDNKKSINNIYINIKSINFIKDSTTIVFYNGEELKINIKKSLITKYIERAFLIQK